MKTNFISFLGAGNYENVPYILPDGTKYNTKYIQAALIHAFKNDILAENGKVVILLTKIAKQKHWDPENTLRSELIDIIDENALETVEIEEIKDEDSLWNLFDKIYRVIPDRTNILFDITHAFRTIPYVGLTIINYARILKHINIKGIYYGAYEAKNNEGAPVIDLTKLDMLFRWSYAIDSYIKYGNANDIDILANEHVAYYNNRARVNSEIYPERSLANSLKKVLPLLSTCRSKEIIEGNEFIRIKEKLYDLTNREYIIIRPLGSVFSLLKEEVELFEKNSVTNILVAVFLCIKYNLIQQGITLLEEGLITILLYTIGEDNYNQRELREAVSRYFMFLDQPGIKDNPIKDEKYTHIIEKLQINSSIENIKTCFNRLRDIRNDINHAGYTIQDIRPITFETNLKSIFKEVLEIFINNKDINELSLIEVSKKLNELI